MTFLWLWMACAPNFEPPDFPAHDRYQDDDGLSGAWHARRMEVPYLCGDPETGKGVSCGIGRPVDENLSCDASGCHGSHDYTEESIDDARHLRGSDGPSCTTCHDQEWSRQK